MLFLSVHAETVHPHACGEIVFPGGRGKCNNGTSPRLWGDLLETGDSVVTLRYIPTLVGRLFERGAYHRRTAVHPHACGEIAWETITTASSDGTSPRLWGDYLRGASPPPRFRYIPTLVGRLT